jgi:hypothetical protein
VWAFPILKIDKFNKLLKEFIIYEKEVYYTLIGAAGSLYRAI